MRITSCEGARHLTIDAVTVRTGLSKGGVLYHFPSKSALLEGLIARAIHQIRTRLEFHIADASDSSSPTLGAMIRVFGDALEGTVSFPVALLAASAENPALLGPIRTEYDMLWQAVKSEASDPDEAFVIWSALEGLYHFDVFGLAPEGRSQLGACLKRLAAMASQLPHKEEQDVV